MVTVSEAFRKAMNNGASQRPLIQFATDSNYMSAVITSEDISIEDGITLNETFNADTDLTMGGCPSATLSFTLFNQGGTLKNFEFGKCKAWIGVHTARIDDDTISPVHLVITESDGDVVIEVDQQTGRILIDGYYATAQPTLPNFVAGSMVLLKDKGNRLVLFDSNGRKEEFKYANGEIQTVSDAKITLNTFMKNKVKTWCKKSLCFIRDGVRTYEFTEGQCDVWQYCSLGVFIAERPKVSRDTVLSISCKDQMTLFDVELPTSITSGTWNKPTVKGLLDTICSTVGVSTNATTFINSDYAVPKRPSDFKTATCRDLLSWIAQASSSYARFNRDGVLELAWFTTTSQVITEEEYEEYEQYWYETKKVNKLVVRDSKVKNDKVISNGDGDNGYIIENNPILGGGT